MSHRKKRRRKKLKNALLVLFSVGVFFGGIVALWAASLPLPDFDSFEQRKVTESTKIYDRTGKILLFDVHENIKRTIVPLDEISLHLKNATIAIEDSEFYDHSGVRPAAILRALLSNIMSGDVTGQGGSTITQQAIKLTLLSGEKKYSRKIKEAVLALKLEKVLSKDDILAIYLNEAPYGGSIYGIEEAAMAFFGKQSEDLSLTESAYLAAIPQAPTYYSPYGDNTEDLENRKNLVLTRMADLEYISLKEAEEAKEKEVLFNSIEERGIKAPHFIIQVRKELEEKYGADVITTQGLKITTSLDWNLQQKAEEIIKTHAEQNSKNFNAYNAGLVSIDPKTGHVLVMVGSRDWFSEPLPDGCSPGLNCLFDPKVNITTRKPGRQPGSAFKPFVYATALKRGYTPETVVFDVPTQFATACYPDGKPLPGVSADVCYAPVNYDNTFKGPVTLRDALAQSINIPAVKVLYLSGLLNSLETAKNMGITTLEDHNRYGLTLVLGGGEVTLFDLTSAYSVFANNGLRNPSVSILKVEDRNGNVLDEYKQRTVRVLEEDIALNITSMLSDNEARSPAFGSFSPLYFPGFDVAAKTGTTNDFRDAWIVGYTPSIAVGAWAGNSDNSSMDKKVAGFVVAPMWNAFMKEAIALTTVEKFKDPASLESENLKPVLRGGWRGSQAVYIDSISGKLATEYTPKDTRTERILTQIHSILHWVDKNKPNDAIPNNPDKDPQYNLWEFGVKKWAETNNIIDETPDVLPTEYDDIHTPENKPKISILTPKMDTYYSKYSQIPISIETQSTHPMDQVDVFFNSSYVGSTKHRPFSLAFTPNDFEISEDGDNTITVTAYDSVRNSDSVTVGINLSDINNTQ